MKNKQILDRVAKKIQEMGLEYSNTNPIQDPMLHIAIALEKIEVNLEFLNLMHMQMMIDDRDDRQLPLFEGES